MDKEYKTSYNTLFYDDDCGEVTPKSNTIVSLTRTLTARA